ncbi:MAG: dethiobiotin synthase, partial [Planctomycetota bacterium]
MAPHLTLFLGTGTEIGKTYCAVRFAQRLSQILRRVGACKPVQSGCQPVGNILSHITAERNSDAALLWDAVASSWPAPAGDNPAATAELKARVCGQSFAAAISPPMAAVAEQRSVDWEQILNDLQWWVQRSRHTIVEGAGGLFSPISCDHLNIDLAIAVQRMKTVRARIMLVAP